MGHKNILKGMAILLVMFLSVNAISAIKNPSAVYCEEMGYRFFIESTNEGEAGLCKFSDGTSVSAWDFLKGKVGQENNYCNLIGLETKIIEDSEKCSVISSYECAVCIRGNEEIEVTTLMNLDFKESVCGDSNCVLLEENYENCPQDCASGNADYYCDKINDSICDPDCDKGGDFDCLETTSSLDEISSETDKRTSQVFFKKSNFLLIIGIILFIGIIVFGIIMFRKLKTKKPVKN